MKIYIEKVYDPNNIAQGATKIIVHKLEPLKLVPKELLYEIDVVEGFQLYSEIPIAVDVPLRPHYDFETFMTMMRENEYNVSTDYELYATRLHLPDHDDRPDIIYFYNN